MDFAVPAKQISSARVLLNEGSTEEHSGTAQKKR